MEAILLYKTNSFCLLNSSLKNRNSLEKLTNLKKI